MSDLSPEQFRDMSRYINEHRSADVPFDLVLKRNKVAKDRDEDQADVVAYERAGVTWWIEGISPWRFEWQGSGEWPIVAMHDQILKGRPR